VEALGADRVVVVRDAVVIALALVQGDEQQFGLACGSASTPAWNGVRAYGREPAHGGEHLADAVGGVQAPRVCPPARHRACGKRAAGLQQRCQLHQLGGDVGGDLQALDEGLAAPLLLVRPSI
jgi:hypothetical protein